MSSRIIECPNCHTVHDIAEEVAPRAAICQLCETQLLPDIPEPPPTHPVVPQVEKPKKQRRGGGAIRTLVIFAIIGAVIYGALQYGPTLLMLFNTAPPPSYTPTPTVSITPTPTPSAWPKGTTACSSTVAVSDKAKCGFAENVATAYSAAKKSGNKSVTLKKVSDPSNKKTYDMTCTVASTAKCTSKQIKTIVYVR